MRRRLKRLAYWLAVAMPKLVQITENSHDVTLDIRYATTNNFTGKPLYKQPLCYLHMEAEAALNHAIALAARHGYRFKIFDAFRPHEVQQALWDDTPDENFLSHPETGSMPHCRGVAVDLTLVDADGNELDMGTGFDEFDPASHHGNPSISPEAERNRLLLMGIMMTAGWDFYRNEWWHYQLFNAREYELFTDISAETGML